MASAWIIEVRPDKTQIQRGLFEFVQLPAAGDRIILKSDDERMLGFGVVQIEHFPSRGQNEPTSSEPSATLYVHWLKEFPVE